MTEELLSWSVFIQRFKHLLGAYSTLRVKYTVTIKIRVSPFIKHTI